MILGIFLTPGDSLEKQALVGQDQRFIRYYLKEYSKNFEKVFIFSYGDLHYPRKISSNIYLLPNRYKFPYFIYQFIICFYYLKEIASCDVVRIMQATGGVPGIISKMFFGKKFIVTYGFDYSFFARIEGKPIKSFILKFLLKLILFFADKIIVTSKKNYKYLKQDFFLKLFYIPNGVDSSLFKPIKRKKSKKFTILNIGRLVNQKNQQLLIDAISLSEFKGEIKLIIIGNGIFKNKLINSAKKKKIDLQVIEKVNHLKLPFYFSQAGVFCLPSLAEGNSKVLLEALSCGIVCLASNIPNNREIIKDKVNGLLFSLDEESLRNKIDLTIKDPKLRKTLSKNARKNVLANYNIFNLLKKEIKILKVLASGQKI